MPLNWKKPHTIHGSGPGNDIVVQDGVLYTRDGKLLPATIKGLETMGMVVNKELREHLVAEMSKRREEEIAKRVREAIYKKEEELREKLSEFKLEQNDDGDLLNLDGLDELVNEAVSAVPSAEGEVSGNIRKKPAPPSNKKK